MRRGEDMKKQSFSFLVWVPLVSLCALLIAGCFPGSKPPQTTEQFTFEYGPPAACSVAALPDALKVNRFSVAQQYNGPSMVYQPTPYRLAVYNLNRWRVNPGDMITDFLIRDLTSSGMFRGVFSYRQTESARFAVEGSVEEFLEIDEQDTGKARITLSVALIDTKETEVSKRLVFQKRYSSMEPLTVQTPEAFARGMSVAWERLSERILKDIFESVRGLQK